MMPLRSLILGHSIARRLGEFVAANHKRYGPNFRLDPSTTVEIFGVGGRTSDRLVRDDLWKVEEVKPDIVVLIIGGNDIDVDLVQGSREFSEQTEEIAFRIMSIASLLHNRYGVTAIVICQLMPRFPRYWSITEVTFARWIRYNSQARAVNTLLCSEIASGRYPFVRFWSHQYKEGHNYFPFPDLDYVQQLRLPRDHVYIRDYARSVARSRFLGDGTHPNPVGFHYLYRSIRGALKTGIRCIRQYYSE